MTKGKNGKETESENEQLTIGGDDVDTVEKRKRGRPRTRLELYENGGTGDKIVRVSKKPGLSEKPQETKAILHHVRAIAALPPIDTSDFNDVEERIEWYFDWCESCGMKPGVVGLANSLGVSRMTLYRWSTGECNCMAQDLAVQAYQTIEHFWEMQMMENKINPVSGIFLGKNHFGYTDKRVVENLPGDGGQKQLSAEELEKKYIQSVAVDITDQVKDSGN